MPVEPEDVHIHGMIGKQNKIMYGKRLKLLDKVIFKIITRKDFLKINSLLSNNSNENYIIMVLILAGTWNSW